MLLMELKFNQKVGLHFMKRLIGVSRYTGYRRISEKFLTRKCTINTMKYVKFVKAQDVCTVAKQSYNSEIC